EGSLVSVDGDHRDLVAVRGRDVWLDPHRDGTAALDRAGPAEDISSGVAERQHGDGRDQPGRLRAALPQPRGGRLHPHAPLRPHRSPARARVWGGGARTRGRRGLRERCEMTLETAWFCLSAALWSGYCLLEGFGVAVGMGLA